MTMSANSSANTNTLSTPTNTHTVVPSCHLSTQLPSRYSADISLPSCHHSTSYLAAVSCLHGRESLLHRHRKHVLLHLRTQYRPVWIRIYHCTTTINQQPKSTGYATSGRDKTTTERANLERQMSISWCRMTTERANLECRKRQQGETVRQQREPI